MARLLSPAQHEELEHQSQSTGSKPLILSLTASSLNPMVTSLSARDICMQTTGECSARSVYHRVVESFLNKFFPSGYPCSVNEGYLRCTRFRALQHFSRAALSVPLRQRKYATGEDALKGWLVAVYASSMKKSSHEFSA